MLKIFCVYFDKRWIWRSDCVESIQAGRARTGIDLGMLADDTDDNISNENARYGEMTAWYWVWKNYLPRHPELQYVGFSHYRRFLDFSGLGKGKTYRTTYAGFQPTFECVYTQQRIMELIGNYDIVVRKATNSGYPTIRAQFLDARPDKIVDFDRVVSLLYEQHPSDTETIDAALNSGMLAMELQFIMCRKLFADFMEWAFSLCREYERRWHWSGGNDGKDARVPAFIIERLFMVWLAVQRQRGYAILEIPLVKLHNRPWWYCLLKPILVVLPGKIRKKIRNDFK